MGKKVFEETRADKWFVSQKNNWMWLDWTTSLIYCHAYSESSCPEGSEYMWAIITSVDLRKFSIGPFSETEKGFGVNPTPGGSQCTGLSPTLSWKWPRATLSPSFGPFFERNHSFGVKMVWENLRKCFKSCPWSWNPTGKKQIYTTGKRSYRTGHICKLFHFALSLKKAITPERVAWLTWFFGSMPKIEIYDHLIF